ncbi:MAG: DUF721 domain-containing protein [Rhodocyclales bacterium]|nr:DUF721 domain-containing protein [Rhodocyclales bacterium]
MATHPLDAYLNSADGLAPLAAHAGRLVKLQRVFEESAPPHLAESSRVANLKLGKVVLHADNGAVAAKLNQLLPSLVDEFCKKGFEVTEIQVKVQPRFTASQQFHYRKAPAVSSGAKAGLQRLAAELPEDAPLKAAVERLVKRSR